MRMVWNLKKNIFLIIQPLCGWFRNEFHSPACYAGLFKFYPDRIYSSLSRQDLFKFIPSGLIQVYPVGIYSSLSRRDLFKIKHDGIVTIKKNKMDVDLHIILYKLKFLESHFAN